MYREHKDPKKHFKIFRITYMLDSELEDSLAARIAEYEEKNNCKFENLSILKDCESGDILTFRTATVIAVFC